MKFSIGVFNKTLSIHGRTVIHENKIRGGVFCNCWVLLPQKKAKVTSRPLARLRQHTLKLLSQIKFSRLEESSINKLDFIFK